MKRFTTTTWTWEMLAAAMLTTKDWLERARGDSPAEALAAAERAARWSDDWNAIAEAWLAQDRPADTRRCITAALDLARGDHWPSKYAAELLLKLGDRDGAVAALGRIAAAAMPPAERVRAYQWVSLARAYRDVLGDEDALHSCLESGAAMAKTTSDLSDLATGYADLLGDRAAARSLLERAEATARETQDFRALWGVAISWQHALADPDRARGALEIATAEAMAVSDLTALATAWSDMFHDDPQLRTALARAETIATCAADWIKIAEAYFDGGNDNRLEVWDRDGVRRALEAALGCELTPEQRAEIATGYRDWLGESADEVAPALRAPELVFARQRALAGWDGREPRALLHRLRELLVPTGLEQIAKSDWGIAWRKHYRPLAAIHATGLIPIPLEWHPLEALELYRWKRGADVDHVARGFACAVLALDAASPTCRHAGHIGNALAPLIESAWTLGLDRELETLLVWIAEVTREADAPWPMLGLVLTRARRDPGDPRLVQLVADLVAAEAASTESWGDTGWLFHTTNYDGYHELWRLLATEALGPPRGLPVHLDNLARLLRHSSAKSASAAK